MGYYIHTVIVFVIGNTIRKAVVTVMIGNYIHRVIVIEGSLFSQEYGIAIRPGGWSRAIWHICDVISFHKLGWRV